MHNGSLGQTTIWKLVFIIINVSTVKMERFELTVEFNSKSVSIPYYHLKGGEAGQKVFISGGIHGDEVNGIFQIKRFLDWCGHQDLNSNLRGELYVFPVLNPLGFASMTRRVPLDDRDLNRSFGFAQPKSISQQVAVELVEAILSKCDLGIDIHDSGAENQLYPHTRIHIDDDLRSESCSEELARWFGLDFNYRRVGSKHMLANHMKTQHDIPVLTVEIGGSQEIHGQDVGLKGVLNVLGHSGMIDYEPQVIAKQLSGSKRVFYRLQQAAVFEILVNPGDRVKSGDELYLEYDPISGTRHIVNSEQEGLILGINDNNQGVEGTKVLSVITDLSETVY